MTDGEPNEPVPVPNLSDRHGHELEVESGQSAAQGNLSAALGYVERGCRLVLLHERMPNGSCSCGNVRNSCPASSGRDSTGKHPRESAWQKKLITTRERAEQLWGRYPTANIGLCPKPDEFVLDIDPRHGGGETFADLEARLGPLTGPCAMTGGGGYHYWLRLPTGISIEDVKGTIARRLKDAGGGIDLRTCHNQVVVAPSVHSSGNAYEWVEGRSVADYDPEVPNAAWLDALGIAPPPTRAMGNTPPAPPLDDDYERARWGLLECRILSADDGYNDVFLRVLTALKGAFGEQGLGLAHEWCRLNPTTYDGPEVDRRWTTLKGTGMQCLAGMFDDARPGWRRECPTGRNHAHAASRDRQAPRDAGQSHNAPTPPSDGQRVALGNRDPATERIVLSTTQTLPSAREFIAAHFTRDGMTTLVSYAGQSWAWSYNHYTAIEDEAVRKLLYPWLGDALRYNAKGRLIDFDSNPRTVEAVRSTIASTSFVQASEHLPFWRGKGAPPVPIHELLLCKGLTLHIPTRQRIAPTPELFAVNALDFDYSEDAKPSTRWLAFLHELFGDDIEAINLLQEWMGYCLTSDTRQQKILLIVGPRRSGKGTIGRVLRKVVGEGNVANPTASSLATNFGLWPLIGKTNAIISDARFSGHGATVVIERLLCISGEDSISIDRKFMAPVNMKLPTRFTLFTNELPRLPDASNALTGRFLVLRLKHSFYGKEDVALSDKLTSETPGILNWALEGWDRLNKRGYFLQPSSSQQAVEDLEDLASPISTFVRESCMVAPEQRVGCSDLYNAWLSWCSERAPDRAPISAQIFGRDLNAAVPVRRRGNGKTGRFYEGIGLRAGGSA